MIGFPDQHCHSCGGICKCGVLPEIEKLRLLDLKPSKAAKRVLEGKDYPTLKRYALEHHSPHRFLVRLLSPK